MKAKYQIKNSNWPEWLIEQVDKIEWKREFILNELKNNVEYGFDKAFSKIGKFVRKGHVGDHGFWMNSRITPNKTKENMWKNI